tara:strand:+ start:105 stop:224 length:120 start_codon:yes stop_codon:yes gene_type:complete
MQEVLLKHLLTLLAAVEQVVLDYLQQHPEVILLLMHQQV